MIFLQKYKIRPISVNALMKDVFGVGSWKLEAGSGKSAEDSSFHTLFEHRFQYFVRFQTIETRKMQTVINQYFVKDFATDFVR